MVATAMPLVIILKVPTFALVNQDFFETERTAAKVNNNYLIDFLKTHKNQMRCKCNNT